MLKELIKLADHLDKKGLEKEASFVDQIIEKNIRKTAGADSAILSRLLDTVNEAPGDSKGSDHGFTEEDRQKLDTIHALLNQIMTQL